MTTGAPKFSPEDLTRLAKAHKERTAEQNPAPEETTPEEPDTSLDILLDNPEFVSYLSKFPDFEKIYMTEDNPVFQERYASFLRSKEVADNIASLYREKVSAEIGLEVTEEDTQCINEWLYTQSIEDPELFQKLSNHMELYNQTLQDVAQVEERMNRTLGNIDSVENLEIRESELNYAAQATFWKRLFNPGIRNRRREIMERYNLGSESQRVIKENAEESSTNLQILEEMASQQQDLMARINETQKNMLSSDMEPLQNLRKQVIEKVKKDLIEKTNTDEKLKKLRIEDISKISNTIEAMYQSGSNPDSTIDWTDNDPQTLEELEILKEDLLQGLIWYKISTSMENISGKETKISSVEEKLRALISKLKEQGLYTEKNKVKILEALIACADETKDKAKKLLLRRVVQKTLTK